MMNNRTVENILGILEIFFFNDYFELDPFKPNGNAILLLVLYLCNIWIKTGITNFLFVP